MPFHVLRARSWVILALCLFSLSEHAVTGKHTKPESFQNIESSCPSQTINYITATLPQQCLRTDWISGKTTINANGDATIPTVLPDRDNDPPTSSIDNTIVAASSNASVASTVSEISASPSSVTEEQDGDTDPLSDNANFLSFEEWKAQMLQKTGQSPEHVAGPKMNQRKDSRAGGINNALDGYGEDGEIEIDFGGFPIADVSANDVPSTASATTESQAQRGNEPADKPQKRSKEAGTTSKQRFNYASFDCAATVLKTNPGSKGSTSILSENKDSYMINACSLQNKFIIVELCDDINIDTIVLGNFEFFSSTFRSFRVSVADRYPVKADKWENIGTFEARNTRGVQAFLVENMRTWGRYLRIEFLTHYGAEYYCPVSLLRVHGKTMIDDWKADVKTSQGEDDDEEEPEDVGVDKVVAEPIKAASSKSATTEQSSQTSTSTIVEEAKPTADYSFYDGKCPRVSLPGPLVEQTELVSSNCEFDRKFCHMAKVERLVYTRIESSDVRVSTPKEALRRASTEKGTKETLERDVAATVQASSASSTITVDEKVTSTSAKSTQTTKTASAKANPKSTQKAADAGTVSKSSGESKSSSSSKSAVNAVASIAPQDSFFRSVHKRLQQLEANSTLSLQYIEEQSRILREAFTKVEKRQLSKTSNFLENLNATVLHELRQFRLQYDQIWQSTVLELSAQREQSQRELTALSQRVSLLADELLWQRRLAIFQFGLIMLCLALVVFSRNSAGTSTFDVPLLHNMVTKPRLSRYLSPESPPGTPSRPSSRYGRLARSWTHFRSPSNPEVSDDENGPKTENSPGAYQLPTPTSEIDEPGISDGIKSSPEPDMYLRKAQSTPNLGKESDDLLDSGSNAEDEGVEPKQSFDEDARESLNFLDTS